MHELRCYSPMQDPGPRVMHWVNTGLGVTGQIFGVVFRSCCNFTFSNLAVSVNWGVLVRVSSEQEPYRLGWTLGLPEFWKLPLGLPCRMCNPWVQLDHFACCHCSKSSPCPNHGWEVAHHDPARLTHSLLNRPQKPGPGPRAEKVLISTA